MTLTPKQKKVLEFITTFSDEHGYSPSQAEIARHFGFKSLGTVQNYLVRLERNGLLQKTMNAQRSMKVVSQPHTEETVGVKAESIVALPLVGKVAAGHPIEAIENHETLDVPADMVRRPGEHFVLRVSGDSMIEDGILEGDYVVIRKQGNANNGQTVVGVDRQRSHDQKILSQSQSSRTSTGQSQL
jgi:repressor LexA